MPAPLAKVPLALKFLLAIAVIAAIAWFALNSVRATAVVATVGRGTAADVVTGSLTVHADKDIQELKSELSGRVIWVDTRPADKPVKAGEKIVELDASDIDREIERAEQVHNAWEERLAIQKKADPRLEIAKENLAAAQRRHQRKEISDDELKGAQRAYDKMVADLAVEEHEQKQARASYESEQAARKRAREKMTIRAPMDGIVRSIIVAPGALIGSGTTVATFFSNERVIKVKVSEEDISRVRIGQPAQVRLLALGNENFEGRVSSILPHADEATQRYTVHLEVKADPAKLMPFANGEATITVAEHPNQPLVPRRALFNDNYVFVVKNGRVEQRQVSIGFKALNYAEVTDKLAEGEQVIVDELELFRDGQRVKVVLEQ